MPLQTVSMKTVLFEKATVFLKSRVKPVLFKVHVYGLARLPFSPSFENQIKEIPTRSRFSEAIST